MDPTDFNWFTLYPCALSFFQRLCSARFPPVSCLFLSPIQIHKAASTIFWRDNQKIAGLGREILYNIQPLILPNTGHTGDLGDAQTPVRGVPGGHHALTCPGTQSLGGRHASTCPGIRSIGGCHASACLGICTLTQGRLALRLQQYWVG